jgi:hypothetical protein
MMNATRITRRFGISKTRKSTQNTAGNQKYTDASTEKVKRECYSPKRRKASDRNAVTEEDDALSIKGRKAQNDH